MKLTLIVTIDPVKDVSHLNVLIHSLNLQTKKWFDVVFFNQTLIDETEIFAKLSHTPHFNYQFFSIDKNQFFGKYPLWDLYAFHNFLLEHDIVNDYFTSLHMEEFLDVDYVENVVKVLEKNDFDIMFGNLNRTQLNYEQTKSILSSQTVDEFKNSLKHKGLKGSHHWAFDYSPMFFRKNIWVLKHNAFKLFYFRFKKHFKPNEKGYTKLKEYIAEDVYFIKKHFAKQYNWFLRGHNMYFSDIHIPTNKVVGELSKKLKKITEFPVYFNLSKIYHIAHKRYYFQLVEDEFTTLMLKYKTGDPILNTLKTAITMHKEGKLSLKQALACTRANSYGTGTWKLNYKYHMKYLNNAN